MCFQRVRGRDILVQWDLGDVDTRPAAEENKTTNDRSVFGEFLVFGRCFFVSWRDNRREGREELDGLRITALFCGQTANVAYFRPQQGG